MPATAARTAREYWASKVVDAAGHFEDLMRYRGRGYAMMGNRLRIVTDRSQSVLEVHPPSANSVNMAGVIVEYYPPHPAVGR